MELIQKPFPLKCEPFKISFVGRPLDPNKGLQSLLDAIELLLSLPEVPIFNFWIIGGEPEEANIIANQIEARPQLQELLKKGMISVWGRIKREALPEFYKRSSILVMPSHREPFGLVAVESMLCGCPVIGTNQGGLSDTIIHGRTGVQAEVDSPKALANSILLYMRNPQIRKTRSTFAREWAKFAFTKSVVYEEVRNLYHQDNLHTLDSLNWNLQDEYIKSNIQCSIKIGESLIGSSIQVIDILNSRYHIVVKIKSKDNFFVLKQFKDRPSLREAVLPLGKTSICPTTEGLVENVKLHANAPYMPKLVAYDKQAGITIHEWLEGNIALDDINDISNLVNSVKEFGHIFHNKEELPNYVTCINNFIDNPSVNNLYLVDDASFRINLSINNQLQVERETHPLVGLHRILMCSELKGWALDEDVLSRIRMTIRLVINLYIPNPEHIYFSHGGIKRKHIFNSKGNIYAFDTEHASFAVGALDIGTWMCSMAVNGTNAFDVLKYVKNLGGSKEYSSTAIQWFVYFLIVGYLIRIHHGEINEPTDKIKHILYNISLAISND